MFQCSLIYKQKSIIEVASCINEASYMPNYVYLLHAVLWQSYQALGLSYLQSSKSGIEEHLRSIISVYYMCAVYNNSNCVKEFVTLSVIVKP